MQRLDQTEEYYFELPERRFCSERQRGGFQCHMRELPKTFLHKGIPRNPVLSHTPLGSQQVNQLSVSYLFPRDSDFQRLLEH